MIRQVRKTATSMAALALMGALAAGCALPIANQPENAHVADQRFPISVEPQMTTIGVRIDPGLQRLDPAEAERVEAFAEAWKTRGQGAITVSSPQGSPNQRAGEAAMSQTVGILRKNGVPDHMIGRTGYPASTVPGEPPVTLSFLSLTAVAPDCSKVGFPDNLGFSPRNTPWATFGCATQNNIAAMVANPRDLLEPKPMGDVDMARRMKVIDTYRKGQATQTTRKDNESGQVSTAAKGGGE